MKPMAKNCEIDISPLPTGINCPPVDFIDLKVFLSPRLPGLGIIAFHLFISIPPPYHSSLASSSISLIICFVLLMHSFETFASDFRADRQLIAPSFKWVNDFLQLQSYGSRAH
ncbi:hypothetical protein Patl1_22048 [Pistacia atlantica]|uniref:Uncharacterized protein n=1 Tax=Pistacia atlantica TaxID=434234 RepID=A0ACC1BI77_9ROSI|nr:hypothetical protein Patl1_22048 [Pistacia atlantica]